VLFSLIRAAPRCFAPLRNQISTHNKNSICEPHPLLLIVLMQNKNSIRQKVIIMKMRGHRGYNICSWLIQGRNEICGKSCREEYCKSHRLLIRRGSKIPNPCIGCGVGVRSEIQLCRNCGRETERYRLKNNISRRQLPLPCICCGVGTVSFNQMCTRCEEKYDVEYK